MERVGTILILPYRVRKKFASAASYWEVVCNATHTHKIKRLANIETVKMASLKSRSVCAIALGSSTLDELNLRVIRLTFAFITKP